MPLVADLRRKLSAVLLPGPGTWAPCTAGTGHWSLHQGRWAVLAAARAGLRPVESNLGSGWSGMFTEQLARERTRSMLEDAERLRYARRLRVLRRASRLEHRAGRRMAQAWRRAAELRGTLESAGLGTGGDVLADLQAALAGSEADRTSAQRAAAVSRS